MIFTKDLPRRFAKRGEKSGRGPIGSNDCLNLVVQEIRPHEMG